MFAAIDQYRTMVFPYTYIDSSGPSFGTESSASFDNLHAGPEPARTVACSTLLATDITTVNNQCGASQFVEWLAYLYVSAHKPVAE